MPGVAFIYARTATEGQDGPTSLDAQVRATREYAEAHGWTVAGDFRDVASSYSPNRTGFERLLACVRQARGAHVVVTEPNRISRSMWLWARFCEVLEMFGASIHYTRHEG